jgi:hypothetical protein
MLILSAYRDIEKPQFSKSAVLKLLVRFVVTFFFLNLLTLSFQLKHILTDSQVYGFLWVSLIKDY